jgi:hypothetical protein
MKSPASPSLFFSAYPLKALKQSACPEPDSSYLKGLLTGKTKTSSRVRIFPMVNPYLKNYKPAPVDVNKIPKDIELTSKDWFNNYE